MSTVTAALATRPANLEQLAALSDEIAALTRAGVPLDRGLKALAAELPGRVGRMASDIGEKLSGGQPLESIIESMGARLPAAYRHVLLAGLKAGQLPTALESVSRTARRVNELRRSIGLALLYPLIVLGLTWSMGLFVVTKIAPVMAAILAEFDVTSPAVLAAFERIIATLPVWGWLVPAAFTAYLAWVWYASGRAAVGYELHPVFAFGALGTLARMQRASRYGSLAELLGLLIASETPLPEAVRLASASLGSPRIAAGGAELAERLARGEPVHDAPPGFPPLLAWMLAAGYSKEQLLAALARSAEVYREEVNRRTQWLAAYVPLMLTIFVAGGAVLLYAALTLGPWLALMRRLTIPYTVFF